MERLDKTIAQTGLYTRREVRALAKKGLIEVDGAVIKDESFKVSSGASITIDDKSIELYHDVVIMLNKPAGYVTSTDDSSNPTVMALIPEEYKRLGVYPVGRLDKDTEGLLIFTNNGDIAHRLISPKHEVEKEYIAYHDGSITEDDIASFKTGIELKDGTLCKSAILKEVESGKSSVIIREGKYHQVRRMMASIDKPVIYLKRVREGKLGLGDLEIGKVRELTEDEVKSLFEKGFS